MKKPALRRLFHACPHDGELVEHGMAAL